MTNSILKFCPACNQEVEYEQIDGKSYCSICGRTHKVAEQSLIVARSKLKQEKVNSVLKVIGVVLLIGFVLMQLSTETGRGELISSAVFITLFTGVLYWGFNRKKKKDKKWKGEFDIEYKKYDD